MQFHYDTTEDALTFEAPEGPLLVRGNADCPILVGFVCSIADAKARADKRTAIPLVLKGARAGLMNVRYARHDPSVITGDLVEPTPDTFQPVRAYAQQHQVPDLSEEELAEASAIRAQALGIMVAPTPVNAPTRRRRGRPSTGNAMSATERTKARRKRLASEQLRLVQVPVPTEAGREAVTRLATIAALLYRQPDSTEAKRILNAIGA